MEAHNGQVRPALGSSVGLGAIAGLGGAVVMTAFQKLVEMPLTGRADSYEPANLVMRILPVKPRGVARKRLNYATHFLLGAGWGAAYGVAASRGLRGQSGVAAVFGTLWPGDVATTVALGMNPPPWRWSARDVAIDVADKFVLAEATGAIYERMAA